MDEMDDAVAETRSQRWVRNGVWIFVLLWGAGSGIYVTIMILRHLAGGR